MNTIGIRFALRLLEDRMRLKEMTERLRIRKILREVFFLIAIGAVFVMVPMRCGIPMENLHADKERSGSTGEITLRDRNTGKESFSLWLRDLERGQGPGE